MEASGADVPKHNEVAYPKSAWEEGGGVDDDEADAPRDGKTSWMPSQHYDKMDHPLSLRNERMKQTTSRRISCCCKQCHFELHLIIGRRGGYFIEPASSSPAGTATEPASLVSMNSTMDLGEVNPALDLSLPTVRV